MIGLNKAARNALILALGAVVLVTVYLLLTAPVAPKVEYPPETRNLSNVTKPAMGTVTTQLTAGMIDYHYTSKTPMVFEEGQFILNNTHKITPFVSIDGVRQQLALSNLTYNYSINDFGYKRTWELTLNRKDRFTANHSDESNGPVIDYVGFDVTNCSKNSDASLRCGGVEVDFSDLRSMGYSVDIINDSTVIVKNDLLLSSEVILLDPTDQLSSSSTNKAYVISWTTTDSPDVATTEFSAAQYTNVTTSNDGYVTSSANQSVLAPCNAPTSTACSCYDVDHACGSCRYGGSCTAGGCPSRSNAVSSSNTCASAITRTGCNACTTTCPA